MLPPTPGAQMLTSPPCLTRPPPPIPSVSGVPMPHLYMGSCRHLCCLHLPPKCPRSSPNSRPPRAFRRCPRPVHTSADCPPHPGRNAATTPVHTYADRPSPPQGVPTLPELKLRYYELLVRYYSHSHNYLEMTRCYRAMYETESIAADMDKWAPVSPWEGRGLGFRV